MSSNGESYKNPTDEFYNYRWFNVFMPQTPRRELSVSTKFRLNRFLRTTSTVAQHSFRRLLQYKERRPAVMHNNRFIIGRYGRPNLSDLKDPSRLKRQTYNDMGDKIKQRCALACFFETESQETNYPPSFSSYYLPVNPTME